MTKYEWETELKKNIHRLPADETARVLEYYGELFADMIERGKKETEIISEFGNPVDVADKILSEYDGELNPPSECIAEIPPVKKRDDCSAEITKTESETVMPEIELAKADPLPKYTEQKTRIKCDRAVLFVFLNIFTGFTLFIVVAVVWIVLGAFIVTGVAMGAGGVLAALWSCVTLFGGSVAAGVAQLGMSIALMGVGIVFTVAVLKLILISAKVTVAAGRGLKNWMTEKKEVAYGKN